jgi:ornithine cyclodeaminase/alanine dehydrogenase-like protein (mu-crystallin family)
MESLAIDELYRGMEDMYADLGNGDAVNMTRSDGVTSVGGADHYRLKSMPGVLPGENVAALRLDSDIVRWLESDDGRINQEKQPRAPGGRYVGLVLIFEVETGTPLVIFPDGYVQKLRVGMASAIGAKHLAPEGARTLGLIGSGWQAEGQIEAMTTVFDLDSVSVYSTTAENREAFADWISSEYGVPAEPVEEAADAFDAEIVHSATDSRTAVYDAEWLTSGTHLGSIGPYESDLGAIDAADATVVHWPGGREEVHWTRDVDPDDVPYLDSKPVDYDEFPTLGELVTGQVDGREHEDDITFFLNQMGMGCQFAVIGSIVHEHAETHDLGLELDDDLFTQELVP